MRTQSAYRWSGSPWKQALDRLAVAWIVCAPVVALAAAWSRPADEFPTRHAALGVDTMTPPAVHRTLLVSHAQEERIESFAPAGTDDTGHRLDR